MESTAHNLGESKSQVKAANSDISCLSHVTQEQASAILANKTTAFLLDSTMQSENPQS